ncbi:MAG TPA: DUF1648 domain-containing protein [Polyangiales bacterium]|nr:DUF1648 domain-containing protein [Polyangiales bacterium]
MRSRPRRTTTALRTPIALIAGFVALAVVRCASVWDELPPVLMSHFNASGRADGFMTRGAFLWTLAAVGGGTVLMWLNVPWLTRVLPASSLNIPNRSYWLPERRPQIQHKLTVFAAWGAAATTALLVATLELVLRANLQQQPLSRVIWLILGAYAVGISLSVLWLVRAFRIPAGAPP